MAADRPKVLVVDDHAVVAAGIKAILSAQYEVLGPVGDGGEVLAALKALRPDALLLDIQIPTRTGMDLLPDIRKDHPRLPVVMLTGSADYLTGRAALVLGALGFLPKDSGADELDLALRTVLEGRQYLSPRVPPPPTWSRSGPLPGLIQKLTPRQIGILRELGKGKRGASLAEELGVAPHTLRFHLRHIREILGVETDDELERAGRALHLHSGNE